MRLLTIAGSDSGGGAGVQADLKTFFALGAHGMAAITAVTAQNTVAVQNVYALPANGVRAQVEAVRTDIGVDAVKTGMMPDAATIEVVAELLDVLDCPVVIDPVQVATSGARLLPGSAHAAMVELLLPRATVCTPNLAEARSLAGDSSLDGAAAGLAVAALGPRSVVVTGGEQDGVDWFCSGGVAVALEGPHHTATATHGSGCTHSAALAFALAAGRSPESAAAFAKRVAAQAIAGGLEAIGEGAGPVHQTAVREYADDRSSA
ncbi:MAG: bifunctional hydroxymethylpyrimidine kinase/phosphomethylpyrimidine kinase [Solirubrobacterales bacterium]